jgi:hypothetical protein
MTRRPLRSPDFPRSSPAGPASVATPWQESIDSLLKATVRFLRDPSLQHPENKWGRPAFPARFFFRYCVGFLGIWFVQQQTRGMARREASRKVARHVLFSPILNELTAAECARLNLPVSRTPADVDAFADRFRKGEQ